MKEKLVFLVLVVLMGAALLAGASAGPSVHGGWAVNNLPVVTGSVTVVQPPKPRFGADFSSGQAPAGGNASSTTSGTVYSLTSGGQ